MVWTAPMTAIENTIFTAVQYNLYVRDNLLETAPAKASVAGSFIVVAGANSIVQRTPRYAENLTTVKGTDGSAYVDLPGSAGPSVTVTTGTNAIVMWSAMLNVDVDNAPSGASYAVSGATTIAASASRRIWWDGIPADNAQTQSTMYMHTNLNPGSNTFTLKFASAASGTDWEQRKLLVIPL